MRGRAIGGVTSLTTVGKFYNNIYLIHNYTVNFIKSISDKKDENDALVVLVPGEND
jgi:hypothetical protein